MSSANDDHGRYRTHQHHEQQQQPESAYQQHGRRAAPHAGRMWSSGGAREGERGFGGDGGGGSGGGGWDGRRGKGSVRGGRSALAPDTLAGMDPQAPPFAPATFLRHVGSPATPPPRPPRAVSPSMPYRRTPPPPPYHGEYEGGGSRGGSVYNGGSGSGAAGGYFSPSHDRYDTPPPPGVHPGGAVGGGKARKARGQRGGRGRERDAESEGAGEERTGELGRAGQTHRQLYDPWADTRGSAVQEGTPSSSSSSMRSGGGSGGSRKKAEQGRRRGSRDRDVDWVSAVRSCVRYVGARGGDRGRVNEALSQAVEMVEGRARGMRSSDDAESRAQNEEGAGAVVAACFRVLEGDDPAAVKPVMDVLKTVDASKPVILAALDHCFGDLVDLLIGWTFEPELSNDARISLEAALQAWGGPSPTSLWSRHMELAHTLLDSFLQDMRSLLPPHADSPHTHTIMSPPEPPSTPPSQSHNGPSATTIDPASEPRIRSLAGLFVIIIGCLPASSFTHAPLPSLILSFLHLLAHSLTPRTPPTHVNMELHIFVIRCLLKISDSLLHDAPSALLVPAYLYAVHVCFCGNVTPCVGEGGNEEEVAVEGGLWDMLVARAEDEHKEESSGEIYELLLSTHMELIQRLLPWSHPDAPLLTDEGLLVRLLGWRTHISQHINAESHDIDAITSAATAPSGSHDAPSFASWLGHWRLSWATTGSAEGELILRTLCELCMRSGGVLVDLLQDELQGLREMLMAACDDHDGERVKDEDAAHAYVYTLSCRLGTVRLTMDQVRRLAAVDASALALALTRCTDGGDDGGGQWMSISVRRASIAALDVLHRVGKSREVGFDVALQVAKSLGAAVYTHTSEDTQAKLESVGAVVAAVFEWVIASTPGLGGAVAQQSEHPTTGDVHDDRGARGDPSTAAVDVPDAGMMAATARARSLEILNELLAQAVRWPILRVAWRFMDRAWDLAVEAVCTDADESETRPPTGRLKGRGLAWQVCMRLLRLTARDAAKGHDQSWWRSRHPQRLRSLALQGLRDPSPRLRAPALHVLSLAHALGLLPSHQHEYSAVSMTDDVTSPSAGPHTVAACPLSSSMGSLGLLGRVMLLQVCSDGFLTSPMRRECSENVKRVIDGIVLSTGISIAGAAGPKTAEDEALWLRGLMLEATSRAATEIDARGDAGRGVLAASLGVSERMADVGVHARWLGEVAKRTLWACEQWALWEAARVAVWGRLKTHLGGAGQTLSALDRALIKTKIELMGGMGPHQQQQQPGGVSTNSLRRAIALLSFVHALERHLIATCEGSLTTDAGHMYFEAREGTSSTSDPLGSSTGSVSASASTAGPSALPPVPPQRIYRTLSDTTLATTTEQPPPEDTVTITTGAAGAAGATEPPPVPLILYTPSKHAETFFRVNRRVTDDFLTRIRPLCLDIATACGAHHDALRHGLNRLRDLEQQMHMLTSSPPSSSTPQSPPTSAVGLSATSAGGAGAGGGKKIAQGRTPSALLQPSHHGSPSSSPAAIDSRVKLTSDTEEAVVQVALAMCGLCDADGLRGLEGWLGVLPLSLPSPPLWIQSLALIARGRHEEALRRLTDVYGARHGGNVPPQLGYKEAVGAAQRFMLKAAGTQAVMRVMVDITVACYVALGDWKGLGAWLKTLRGLHSALSSAGHPDEPHEQLQTEEHRRTSHSSSTSLSPSASTTATSTQDKLSLPSWFIPCLEPRADPEILQALMRIDSVAMGPRSLRRPSLRPHDMSDALSIMNASAVPFGGSWAAHHHATTERALASGVDEVLGLLAERVDTTHADRLRALETQGQRIVDELSSASAYAGPTAGPDVPPARGVMEDVVCMQSLVSAIRKGGGDVHRPHTAFSCLIDDGVVKGDARAWANILRTASAIEKLDAVYSEDPSSPFASPTGDRTAVIKAAWARASRKYGNVALARDVWRRLSAEVGRGGSSTVDNSTDAALLSQSLLSAIDDTEQSTRVQRVLPPHMEVMRRYEEAQLLYLEGSTDMALNELLCTAALLSSHPARDRIIDSTSPVAPQSANLGWLLDAAATDVRHEVSTFNQVDDVKRRHWLYRCLARSGKWLSSSALSPAPARDGTGVGWGASNAAPWWREQLEPMGGVEGMAARCLEAAAQVKPYGGKGWRLWAHWNYSRGKAAAAELTSADRQLLEGLADALASHEASGDLGGKKEGVMSVLISAASIAEQSAAVPSQSLHRQQTSAGGEQGLKEAVLAATDGASVDEETLAEAASAVKDLRRRRVRNRAKYFAEALRAYCRQLAGLDDGHGLTAEDMRPVTAVHDDATADHSLSYDVGDEVKVRSRGSGVWMPGAVVGVDRDRRSYSVRWDGAKPEPRNETLVAVMRVLKIMCSDDFGSRDADSAHEDAVVVVGDDEWTSEVHSTPIEPWRSIAPQVLARVASTHSDAVAARLLPLAERIVIAAPHDVSWSVVVSRQDADTKLGPEGDVIDGGKEGNRGVALRQARERFAVLERALSVREPGLLGEVMAFVAEMEKMSLLWEERWLAFVLDRWSGLYARLKGLAKEAGRLVKNHTLSDDEKKRIAVGRYEAVLSPLYTEADALARETVLSAAGPITEHDKAFCAAFRGVVDELLSLLRGAPSADVAVSPVQQVWPRLDGVRVKIVDAVGKRGAHLRLEDVAPGLVRLLHATRWLRMPGMSHETFWRRSGVEAVRVVGVSSGVEVLRTKTRPKRIALVGEDGREYGYLLKAREDLHLDQRIMQLLAVTNAMLSSGSSSAASLTNLTTNHDTPSHAASASSSRPPGLRARHYAVIPLSSHTGLVQWVDGVLPLFALYKAWRARVARGQRIVAAVQGPQQPPAQPQQQQQAMQMQTPPGPPAQMKPASPSFASITSGAAVSGGGKDVPLKPQRGGRSRGQRRKGAQRADADELPPTGGRPGNGVTNVDANAAARQQQAPQAPPPQQPQAEDGEPVGEVGEDDEERAPAAMFYAELIPALAERGMGPNTPRHLWPKDVLRAVFERLSAKAPRHVIAQEVTAGAKGPDDWYLRQVRLAQSVAVMSMVGAAIGLGDRHLNNILLDTRECEVLHIDYNVCFERGARLKVPEVVPFRMTPSLVKALGPLGTHEGHFRAACEVTLRALRRHRELVLFILDALAQDPVVEWAGGGQEQVGGETREAMEARVTLKLFVLRVGEVRGLLEKRVVELEDGLRGLSALVDRVVREKDAWAGGKLEQKIEAARARGQEVAIEKASAANRLAELDMTMGPLQSGVNDIDAVRRRLEQGLRDVAKDLNQRLAVIQAAIDSVVVRSPAVHETVYATFKHKVRKAYGDGGSVHPPALTPGHALLSEGLSLLPRPATEMDVMDRQVYAMACMNDEARTLTYLMAWANVVGPACDALSAYRTALVEGLALDVQAYAERCVLRSWAEAIEALLGRAALMEALEGAGATGQEAWGLVEGGTAGVSAEITRAFPVHDRSADARLAVSEERVRDIMAMHAELHRRRDARSRLEASGSSGALAQSEAEAAAALDETRERLKRVLKTYFRASNLRPPASLTSEAIARASGPVRRQLAAQQDAQRGMHGLLLHLLTVLDALWRESHETAAYGEDLSPSDVLDRAASLLARVEVVGMDVVVPSLGRVEDLQGLGERFNRIRTTLTVIATAVRADQDGSGGDGDAGALSGLDLSGSSSALVLVSVEEVEVQTLGQEAHELLQQWRDRRSTMASLLAERAAIAVRGNGDALNGHHTTNNESALEGLRSEYASWRERVDGLRPRWDAACAALDARTGGTAQALASVSGILDKLASELLPLPAGSVHGDGRDIEVDIGEAWVWYDREYCLWLERASALGKVASSGTNAAPTERGRRVVSRALCGAVEGVVLHPLALLSRTLTDRVVRVLLTSAPHVASTATTSVIGDSTAVTGALEVQTGTVGVVDRYRDRIAAYAEHAGCGHEGAKEGAAAAEGVALLTEAMSLAVTLDRTRRAAQAATADMRQAKDGEDRLDRELRKAEWEHEGDLRALSVSGRVAYTPVTEPFKTRAAVLEALSAVLPGVGMLAGSGEGHEVVSAWRVRAGDMATRLASCGVLQKQTGRAWEGKVRAMTQMLERTADGIKLLLGAIEGVLALEKARPDMRGLIGDTDAVDRALFPLLMEYELVLRQAASKKKELGMCSHEVAELRGRMGDLEREVEALQEGIKDLRENKGRWAREEFDRREQTVQTLKMVVEGLRNERVDTGGAGGGGARVLDASLASAVAKAAGKSRGEMYVQLKDAAEALMSDAQGVEAAARVLAEAIEDQMLCDDVSMMDEGRYAAALEALVELVTAKGGEVYVEGIGRGFRCALEKLEQLVDTARDVVSGDVTAQQEDVTVKIGASSSTSDDNDEEEEEGEEGVMGGGVGGGEIPTAGGAAAGVVKPVAGLAQPEEPGVGVAAPGAVTTAAARVAAVHQQPHPLPYALSALRRVRAKLEGGSADGGGGVGVTEQVEQWIHEAASPDRLCVMYEGWTPFL